MNLLAEVFKQSQAQPGVWNKPMGKNKKSMGEHIEEQMSRGIAVKEIQEGIWTEGLGTSLNKFRDTRKLIHLNEYETIYWPIEEWASKHNFPEPGAIREKYKTDIDQQIELQRKRDEAKIQESKEVSAAETKKNLPMTTKQVNDALFKLVKAKAQLRAGKGLSNHMMLLMTAMNPKAMAEFGGDPKEAIAEIDRQIQYYKGLLGVGKVQKALRGGDVGKQRRPNESPTQYLKRIGE